ncbi:hypothetical protein [Halobaculum sp. D14]|uniref:hypothetical protein n=1 Tax=unclassified Halobaculum TaxID=2640896 RepID=UPI003EBA9599
MSRRSDDTGADAADDEAEDVPADEELTAAVSAFLADAETVREEYEQGYMDADAAVSLLWRHIDELRDVHEAHGGE